MTKPTVQEALSGLDGVLSSMTVDHWARPALEAARRVIAGLKPVEPARMATLVASLHEASREFDLAVDQEDEETYGDTSHGLMMQRAADTITSIAAERDQWREVATECRTAMSRISGTLCDAGDVEVNPLPEGVAKLVAQRNEARQRVAELEAGARANDEAMRGCLREAAIKTDALSARYAELETENRSLCDRGNRLAGECQDLQAKVTAAEHQQEEAVDITYGAIDRMLSRGQLPDIDALLDAIEPSFGGTVLQLLAFATITLPIAKVSRARDRYLSRLREHLTRVDPQRVDALLAGLETGTDTRMRPWIAEPKGVK